MELEDGYVYCIAYCPTGFIAPGCTAPAASAVLESFQFHDNHSYIGERGAEIEIVTGQPAAHYAGFYFVDENTRLEFSDPFTLPLEFSMSSWVLFETNTVEQTLFSKDTFENEEQTGFTIG